jgi:Na+/proline symporter
LSESPFLKFLPRAKASAESRMLIHIKRRVSRRKMMTFQKKEVVMKQVTLRRMFLGAAVVACGVAGSIDWSQSNGLSLSVVSAQARVGRPLTPVSVAGVARRTTRRAVVGGAVVGGAAAGCVRVLVNGTYVCR